ncbi:hypothetical protein B0H10DRAFT_2214484 [Mycena sp. CBHHK59/15]|nr:hypothetical protein B0H10DRAFT_2214484 [Mycena sp. CBHHK59/15]
MSSTDQCARGPDGELLDASKIKFYHDPDDDTPLPPVPDASTPAGGQATQIDQYFRRSERSRKQSSRLTDPNNAVNVKRKANGTNHARPSTRARRSSPSPARMDEDEQAGDDDDDMPDCQKSR